MKKIIHVDNSQFFRKQMKIFLESEGFEVESYDSALEASFAIGGGLADMVIMGLAFAGIDGEVFLKRAVQSFDGPIIVVSSSTDERITNQLLSLGARAALSKLGSWKQELKPYLSAL